MSKPKSKFPEIKLFELIRGQIKNIPSGRVATYGQVALRLRSGPVSSRTNISPRIVGWALHGNKNPEVPCHRVVDRNGRLALNFVFDGAKEQRRRLLREGIGFSDEMHVNLDKHRLNPNNRVIQN